MLISAGRIFEIMVRETRALRVPHDGSPASLRRTFPVVENGATGPDEYLVDDEILPYLMEQPNWLTWEDRRHESVGAVRGLGHRPLLGKLSELGMPPVGQRQHVSGWKCGWRELGLDGDVADWYVFIQ